MPLEKQKHETKRYKCCTGAMRCQQLSQNLGSLSGGLFFPLFFWNSLKEIGKEGSGRADAVQRSFGVSGDQQRALPKEPAPSWGFYCFTAKIRKAFPSEGFFKLSDWTPFFKEPT